MARSKRPAHTVIRMGPCQRWGVCDAGTADMCAGDRKTMHCVQHVAAQCAETHHRQGAGRWTSQGPMGGAIGSIASFPCIPIRS